MARILANVVLYLGLICSIINANESDKRETKDAAPEAERRNPLTGFAYLAETFDDENFQDTWVLSEAKKDATDEDIAKYDGIWSVEEAKKHAQDGDLGLVLKSKARHAAISAPLSKPFYFKDKPLIVQYEVNFQEGQQCGGAYLKLLTLDHEHEDLKKFHDKTPYTIMFGPDKCGNDHKLHFIFRHKNPLNGSIEEKHCRKPKDRLEDYFKDKQSHLYTLIVRPDNSFEIRIDNKVINSGSLLDDFTPPVNPPLEIENPDDVAPEDWDDREKIPDALAVKPDDWAENEPPLIVDEDDVMPDGWLEDEPPMIPNPDSVKPDDWDVDMDGEWEPPEIPNPKCADVPGCGPYKQKMKKNPLYKGKWVRPLINNPNYQGKWKPRLIHNPNYFNDEHPFRMSPIFAVGFELWSMSTDIYFDNIIITDDEEVAQNWAAETFELNQARIAGESVTLWGRILRATNYKPGWWALYFVYCAIPIVLYIGYLIKRAREDKCELKPEDKQPLSDPSDVSNEEKESNEAQAASSGAQGETEGDAEAEPDAEPEAEAEAEGDEEEVEVEEEGEEGDDDAGKTSESYEIIEGENQQQQQPVPGGDGPRRRRPNKE